MYESRSASSFHWGLYIGGSSWPTGTFRAKTPASSAWNGTPLEVSSDSDPKGETEEGEREDVEADVGPEPDAVRSDDGVISPTLLTRRSTELEPMDGVDCDVKNDGRPVEAAKNLFGRELSDDTGTYESRAGFSGSGVGGKGL